MTAPSEEEIDGAKYDFNPYKLPIRYLTCIGLITSTAAQTEAIVQDAIAGVLGVDSEYGRAITTHMNMPLRFNVLRSVAEIKIDDLDQLDRLDDLIDAISTAFERRNATVHHSWCRDQKTNEIFTIKESARGSVRQDLIPMPIKELEADASAIYAAGMELYIFLLENKLLPAITPVRNRFHKTKPERKKRREAILRGEDPSIPGKPKI